MSKNLGQYNNIQEMKKRKISPNAYEKAYKLICKRLKADDLRCVESGIVPGTWMLASKFGIIRILAVDGFSRYSSKNLRSRDAIMNFVEDCAADGEVSWIGEHVAKKGSTVESLAIEWEIECPE